MSKIPPVPSWLKDIPNQLTLFRIAVIPLLLVFYPLNIQTIKLFCAFLFIVAAATDWLDGFLARLMHAETKLGVILDPIADKMLTTAAVVLLTYTQALWGWLAGLLLCRDVGISGLRLIAMEQDIHVPVHPTAKAKTFFLDIGLFALMLEGLSSSWPSRELGMLCIWAGFFCSYYSGWIYAHNVFMRYTF